MCCHDISDFSDWLILFYFLAFIIPQFPFPFPSEVTEFQSCSCQQNDSVFLVDGGFGVADLLWYTVNALSFLLGVVPYLICICCSCPWEKVVFLFSKRLNIPPPIKCFTHPNGWCSICDNWVRWILTSHCLLLLRHALHIFFVGKKKKEKSSMPHYNPLVLLSAQHVK